MTEEKESRSELLEWIRKEIDAKEEKWIRVDNRIKQAQQEITVRQKEKADLESAIRNMELMEAMLEGKI